MSFAARNEVLKADVKRIGRIEHPPCPQQVQPGQMLTCQEVGYITRRQPKSIPDDLHRVISGEAGSLCHSPPKNSPVCQVILPPPMQAWPGIR